MSLSSPLSQIINVLTETEALAQQYKELLQQNAQATQAVLVEPVLRALGWNCNDPRYVRRNLVFQGVELDYALYDDDGKICTLIKVATLGENLQNEQLIEPLQVFAQFQDIDFVILTNGSEWQFLRPSGEEYLEVITILRQHSDAIEDFAQRLISRLDICNFWRFQLPDHLTRLYQLVDQLQSELNLARQTKPELIQEDANPPDDGDGIPPFIPLKELGSVKGRKPLAGRLPTDEIIRIRSWRELMVRSCYLVLQHNLNLELPIMDQAGKKIALIDHIPPKEGSSFEEMEYNGRTVYIYTNYDATHQVLNAIHILEYLPAELKQVEAAAALRDSE